MAVQTSYPGVYIDEFAPGAPIQGVGTSTAAFLGVAARGVIDRPEKLTSFARFQELFGERPVPGFFLWYAVRGFFQNGGQVCYCVRASNGVSGTKLLPDRSAAADPTIRVTARVPGSAAVSVAVAESHLLATADVYQPEGELGAKLTAPARQLTLKTPQQAALFRPGDRITLEGGSETGTIVRVAADVLHLDRDLNADYAVGRKVRLANAATGTKTLRLAPSPSTTPLPDGHIQPGTTLTILDSTPALVDTQVVQSVQVEHLSLGQISYRVTFREGLAAGLDMTTAYTVRSEEFDVTVSQGVATKTYPHLSPEFAHPNYFARVINGDATGLIRAEPSDPPSPAHGLAALPLPGSYTTSGGANEDLTSLNAATFQTALDALRSVDDVNLVAVPDLHRLSGNDRRAAQLAVVTHCEQLADRFGILDAESSSLPMFGSPSVEQQRRSLESSRGYAALYYPWFRVLPVDGGEPIAVPPSGHVCGVIARSDLARGVHKAPANENVNGVLDVTTTMSDVDQGQLNLLGVNVVRVFQQGGRAVVWGARTTARDTNWQYVSVRRLFLYLEESIQDGIRWAVFEPNTTGLWKKLQRSIRAFLLSEWRKGALFGEEADDAFYVRIDDELNPPSEQALGRLHLEIGVRPAYPAEFIVVHIGIWHGGSEVNEN